MDTGRNNSLRNRARGSFLGAAGLKLGMAMATVASAGCSAAGDRGSEGMPPASGGAAPTVSVQGIALSSGGNPVAGVSVCLQPDLLMADGARCTTSDASGAWALAGAPANSLVAITFVKEGFLPTLRPVVTTTQTLKLMEGDTSVLAAGDWAGVLVSPLENPATAGNAPGKAVNPTVGHIAFSTATGGAEPATPAAVTLGGTNRDAAPFFVDAKGNLLDVTSGTRGLFVNLAPALYTVTFDGGSARCQANGGLYGAPSATAAGPRLMVPVLAGFVTLPVAVDCMANSK